MAAEEGFELLPLCPPVVCHSALPDLGLILDYQWIEKILSGEKSMEVRSRNCKVRDRIGLCKNGLCFGTVVIHDSWDITGRLDAFTSAHAIKPCEVPDFLAKTNKDSTSTQSQYFGWLLKNPIKFDEPIPYEKTGARIWVRLGGKTMPMRKREESLSLDCSTASQSPKAGMMTSSCRSASTGLAVDSGFTLLDSLSDNNNHDQRFNFTECFSWASLCFSWLLKNLGVTALILGFACGLF